MKNSTHGFEQAGRRAIQFLAKQFDFETWALTRINGSQLLTLYSEGNEVFTKEGSITKFEDSLCYQVANSNSPYFATQVSSICEFADCSAIKNRSVGAYIGLPLYSKGGVIFGTLCGYDSTPKSDFSDQEKAAIKLIAELLSEALQLELELIEHKRNNERLLFESQTDAMTGLYNRRAWDSFIIKEEERCARFGHSAGVIVIDLNGLKAINDNCGHAEGDNLISKAALIIQDTIRKSDIAARLGGDEFTVLAIESNENDIKHLIKRIKQNFLEHHVAASFGYSEHLPGEALNETFKRADMNMYANKRISKEHRI